jgi:hypothetical protein
MFVGMLVRGLDPARDFGAVTENHNPDAEMSNLKERKYLTR